ALQPPRSGVTGLRGRCAGPCVVRPAPAAGWHASPLITFMHPSLRRPGGASRTADHHSCTRHSGGRGALPAPRIIICVPVTPEAGGRFPHRGSSLVYPSLRRPGARERRAPAIRSLPCFEQEPL